jgi:DNA-binding transcriptional ArsR family regulator
MNVTGPIAALHDNAAHVAERLRLLAHRDRLIMLCRMTGGEVSVGELVTLTGQSQASVSQHLAVLRDAGAVRVRAEAQSRFYRLVDAQIAGIIAALSDYSGRVAGEPA